MKYNSWGPIFRICRQTPPAFDRAIILQGVCWNIRSKMQDKTLKNRHGSLHLHDSYANNCIAREWLVKFVTMEGMMCPIYLLGCTTSHRSIGAWGKGWRSPTGEPFYLSWLGRLNSGLFGIIDRLHAWSKNFPFTDSKYAPYVLFSDEIAIAMETCYHSYSWLIAPGELWILVLYMLHFLGNAE